VTHRDVEHQRWGAWETFPARSQLVVFHASPSPRSSAADRLSVFERQLETDVHEGGTNVRSSTSRALGFLFVALGSVALGSACSSSSDSSGAAPPPFSGTVATTPQSPPSEDNDIPGASATDTTDSTPAGSQQTAGSSTPSSNEGAPNVMQLNPSPPAANAGSNSGSGGSSGAMQAQGAAGQAASR
jgi:hypothetical protein